MDSLHHESVPGAGHRVKRSEVSGRDIGHATSCWHQPCSLALLKLRQTQMNHLFSRSFIFFATCFLLLFLHVSYGTPEIPDCGSLVGADWAGNMRWDHTEPDVPFRWVHTEPYVPFRWVNTEPDVPIRWVHTEPSMHFRKEPPRFVAIFYRWGKTNCRETKTSFFSSSYLQYLNAIFYWKKKVYFGWNSI